MNLTESKTKNNLLRAFAGESQARNRYTFAAEQMKTGNLYVLYAIFEFTAQQEKAHAKVFYDYLKDLAGENISIEGAYPVDIYNEPHQLLKATAHNESEEFQTIYPAFAKVATEEGFLQIAQSFTNIATVEQSHETRFRQFADLMENNQLFISDIEEQWMCLNCGHIFSGKKPPQQCPVCNHNIGYFIRLSLAPYVQK